MAQLFRMVKEHRSIFLIPLFVFAVFILLQCILQGHTFHSSRWSLTYRRNFDGEASQNLINDYNEKRGTTWETMFNGRPQQNSLTDGADDNGDKKATYFNIQESQSLDDDEEEEWGTEDEEERQRLRQSPYIYHEDEELTRLKLPVIQKSVKYISYYQPYDTTQKSFSVCRYNMCEYASKLSRADVIAFKAALIRDHGVPTFLRPKQQRWVMFTSDPASKNYNLESPEMRSQFNATCTYRLDADIKWTFGKLREVQPPPLDYDKIFDSKERTAAWFVSHCNTFGRREDYVRRMQTVFNIDVFGLCNNRSCGDYNHRKDDTTPCLPMLSQRYKFYLSFENTFCEDYVTEKFFKLFKNINVIPVVRGAVDYNNLFPSDVFINAADFDSPEKLAQYLVDLGNDKERYLRMLKKKSRWVFTPGGEMKHCMLCEYAHTQLSSKYHPDIKEVFNGDYPHCWKPTDLV